jgi:diamine N-acetyltransferase
MLFLLLCDNCRLLLTARELVGYALYYHCYSTFEGRSMYLEDIFVCPDYRGRGIASQMLKNVASVS